MIGAPRGTSTSVPDEMVHLLLQATNFRVKIETTTYKHWRCTDLDFGDDFKAGIHALFYANAGDAVTDIRVVEQ